MSGNIGAGGAQALERRLAHKRRGFRTKRLYAELAALQTRLREAHDHEDQAPRSTFAVLRDGAGWRCRWARRPTRARARGRGDAITELGR